MEDIKKQQAIKKYLDLHPNANPEEIKNIELFFLEGTEIPKETERK